jgi:hypothetical protein
MFVSRVTTWRFALALFLVASVLALPLLAYDVALKDGRIIHFKKYRVAESKLCFTDDEGREDSVELESINIDLTRQLNRNENPPLELPGLSKNQANEAPPQQPSLGDLARQVRGNKPTTTQRIYTNDDLQPATDEDRIQDWIKASASPASSDPAERRRVREKAVAFARACQRLTEQEVATLALGKLDEVQFPGRDRWQAQLYGAHQKLYTLLETCVERTDEENHVACSQMDSAQTTLRLLQLDGTKRATSWKEDREK